MQITISGKYTREEKLSKLLDDLITLYRLENEDYWIIEESLKEIKKTAQNNPEYLVSASLTNNLNYLQS
jgi:hypothetical protein